MLIENTSVIKYKLLENNISTKSNTSIIIKNNEFIKLEYFISNHNHLISIINTLNTNIYNLRFYINRNLVFAINKINKSNTVSFITEENIINNYILVAYSYYQNNYLSTIYITNISILNNSL